VESDTWSSTTVALLTETRLSQVRNDGTVRRVRPWHRTIGDRLRRGQAHRAGRVEAHAMGHAVRASRIGRSGPRRWRRGGRGRVEPSVHDPTINVKRAARLHAPRRRTRQR
jgi:hypothetical protein